MSAAREAATPVPATSLCLPRSADNTVTLTITVDHLRGGVTGRLACAGRERAIGIAWDDHPRLHRHKCPTTGGMLWLGTAGFPISAVEVDAVRDLFHEHCVAFDDARETTR